MRSKVTGIVPTFNEERNIEQCLKSLHWVDELLVVDSGSTDRTVEIAKQYADTVLVHEYKYSAAQKNWTIPQAKNEWIILLDADEQCTDGLQREVEEILESDNPEHGAYWIYRRNHFLGKEIKHCRWNHDKVIRLFKRDGYCYEDLMVHAEITPQDNVGRLKHRLVHHSYHDLDDYYKKLIRYTPWGAKKLLNKGKRGSVVYILFNPAWEFFRRYFLYLGFLDGIHGLILCLTSSVMVLFRYVSLWDMSQGDKRKGETLGSPPGGEK